MKKRLLYNTISSIFLQVITILCGFVLPRVILESFGSEVNGLVQSISQFLALITFMELGIGAVIQSSLYKPISENDFTKISEIISSGSKFFKRIAMFFIVYVILLICFYPFLASSSFEWFFTATLIGSMFISSFAQYYFGIVDTLLLNADQKGYVQNIIQIIALIINTLLCVFLIKLGASIQIVKLMSSLIFLIKPIILRLYVNKKYKINRKMHFSNEPIKQKWNGIAQHISSVVLDGTDNVVLTSCSTLSNVSIYSVYHNVIYGVKNLITSTTNGFQPVLGDYYAKNETKNLSIFFNRIEFLIHAMTILLFTCTAILILPFIEVYTFGIEDAEYIQPLFAYLIVIAHGFHCLRLPYHILIKSCGKYKETQRCYVIAAVMNIFISIITVYFLGLIGVALGTLVAMIYQTIWMYIYDEKNILHRKKSIIIKQFLFDIVIIFSITFSTFWLKMHEVSYFAWFILAIKVTGISVVITALISFIFYRKQIIALFDSIKFKMRKQR